VSTDEIEQKDETWRPDHSKRYMIFLLAILGLAHILDEYSTLAPSMIQSSIVWDFFVQYGISETVALQTMSILGLVTLVLMVFSQFFKGLQDNYGRRNIFLISAVGMTIGVFVQSISINYPIYFIGSSIAMFFLFNDMQYVYINEETSGDQRAQAFTATKIIGLFAIFLVPVIRSMYISEAVENWRPVLIFPVIVGIIVIILAALFLKETSAYVILEEDRTNNPEKYAGEKINLRQTIRDLKKTDNWSQIKWIIITTMIVAPFAMLNLQYSEMFMDQLGILHDDRNFVMMLSVLGMGVIYAIQGQVADRMGRRPSFLMNGILVVILVPIEYLAMIDGSLIVAGLTQGVRLGAFWNITDLNRFMLIENAPTRLRGYTQTLAGICMFIMMPIGIIGTTILLGIVTYVYDIVLWFGVPFVIIGTIIVYLKVKETVQVDITTIEG